MSKIQSILLYSIIFALVFSAALYLKTRQAETESTASRDEQPAALSDDETSTFRDSQASQGSIITDGIPGRESHDSREQADLEGLKAESDELYDNRKTEEDETYPNAGQPFSLHNDQAGYIQQLQDSDTSSSTVPVIDNDFDTNTNPLIDNTTPGRKFGTISEGTVESKNINKYYPGRSNKINPWAIQEFYGTPEDAPKDLPPSEEFDERRNRLKESIDKLR